MRIFPNSREFILLGLPLLMLALAAGEKGLGWQIGPDVQSKMTTLVNVLFLSSLHIVFTFQLAFTVPTYYKILTTHSKKWGAAIVFFMVGVFAFIHFMQEVSSEVVSSSIIFVLSCYVYYHTARQFLGLSLIYNVLARREQRLDSAQLEKLKRAERIEHRGVMVHIGAMVFHSALEFGMNLMHKPFPIALRFIFAIFGMALVFYMMAQYARVSRTVFKNKIIFMSRFFLMVLSYFSFMAFLATKLVHGTEYLMIYRRIKSHTDALKQKPKLWLYGVALIFAFAVIMENAMDPNVGLGLDPHGLWQNAILILAGGLVWFHYYVDGILFAMRREDVRAQTGEWLLSDYRAPSGPLGASTDSATSSARMSS